MDRKTQFQIDALEASYQWLGKVSVDDWSVGLCAAIHEFKRNALTNDWSSRDEIREWTLELYNHIWRALGQYPFYQSWLFNATRFNCPGDEGVCIRHGRLAWIDAMIAALKEGRPLPEKPSLPSDYKPRPEPVAARQFNI